MKPIFLRIVSRFDMKGAVFGPSNYAVFTSRYKAKEKFRLQAAL
jgi:hypothetical protein